MPPKTAAPERSLDQRMDALHHANVVRSYRAGLKRDLKAGRIWIVDVIMLDETAPLPHGAECGGIVADLLETAKVFDVLLATPKYGRVKANKMLQLCRISPSKTLGGLSQRQRSELASMIRR